MNQEILNHYLKFSVYTNPGCYIKTLQSLPDNVPDLCNLICHNFVHRLILKEGNTNANKDLKYGDMTKFPWHRLRCEDDVLTTAVSIISELFRLDNKGFYTQRPVENKIVITCRHAAILYASILKSKGIPCRVRSGFAPYFFKDSWDHWLNQYWDKNKQKWITFDGSGFFDNALSFNPFDIPDNKFDWAAKTWLDIRQGLLNADNFFNAGGFKGLMPVLWAVFYDFHCLMNNEILYTMVPSYIYNKFDKLTEKDFKEIDSLAELMLDPDQNFTKLKEVWNTKKKFRILNSPLIDDASHVKYKD